jgi:hypothetical protein
VFLTEGARSDTAAPSSRPGPHEATVRQGSAEVGCAPMSVVEARSRLGNAVKKAKSEGQQPDLVTSVVDARRDLAEAKIRAFVAKTVAAAPPLTEEQRSRLSSLLSGPSR